MRSIGMSIEDIKEYIMLCQKGVESVEQRKTMLIKQKEETLTKLQAFNLALEHLDYKISLYEQACKNKEDSLNPLNTKTIPQDCKNKKN